MFYSRSVGKNRRIREHSQCRYGRVSRRLRAEVLEGRMMLSVASPTPASPLLTTQVTTLYGDYNGDYTVNAQDYTFWRKAGISDLGDAPLSINIEPLATLVPHEGGYVFNQLSAANYHVWTAQFGSPTVLSSDLDSYLIGISGSFDGGSIFDAADYVVWRQFSTLGTGGFVARSINLQEFPPNLPSTSQPDANRDGTELTHPEGGLISIDSKPPMNDLASNTDKREAVLSGSTDLSLLRSQSDRVSGTSTSADREISGEWARAAVFEIAGGEPIASRTQTEAAHFPSAAASAPFSSTGSAQSSLATHTDSGQAQNTSDNKASRASAISASATGRDNATSQPTIGESDRSAAVDAIPALDLMTALPLIESSRHTLPLLMPAYSQLDEAVDLAFDQIGDGEHALTPPSSERSRLDSWLNGTPLLLMFALERISARSSRRRRAAERRLEAIESVGRQS